LKRLDVKKGGVIIRTAAEGASAEDIERDLVFLQRLWKTIETQAKAAKAPSLVYQEAELPLRVIRDLFTEDFERALVDHERTYKRVVGYLKKTSPHMADRVVRYREKTPLNVTDGPREILTRKCTVCGGDGVVLSEASAAVDVERHLRSLAASAPRTKAFKVELNARVASTLVGPGASRLLAIEEETKRRFLLVFREDVPVNHFEVLGKGTLESLVGQDARAEQEGKQVELKLGEVGRHDVN